MTPHRPGPLLRLAAAGLAWLGGVAAQLQQPALLPPALAAALAVAAALGAALLLPRRQAGAWFLGVAALALAAFATTDWRASRAGAASLDPALEGRDLVVTGTVAGLPRLAPGRVRFELAVESARLDGQPVVLPPRLSLSWVQGWDGEVLMAEPAQPLVAGDRWRLPVRLKRPHGPMNPHGFDLELWLFERGLGATGSVRPGAQRLQATAAHPVARLRQHLRDAILLRVDDGAAAGVVAALAVGDQAAIERADWDRFRDTGVAHLMSISGLHVTLFAWLAAALIGALWRRWPRGMRALPAPHAARWGGLLLAFGYALLAGWGVPAQRTVVMLAVVVLLRSAGLRWPGPLILLASGCAVVLMDPWALGQPGFWLSFVAVGLLIVADDGAGGPPPGRPAGWRDRLRSAAAGAVHTQVVATLGLAPLTLLFFQQVSVVGFVANLVAIPVVTLLITPLALAGMLLPPLWVLAGWAVQALSAWLGWLAAWPVAVWTAAAPPPWLAVAGLAGGLLLVAPLPWRLRVLGLPLLLALMLPPVPRPPAGQFELVAADVGQGTAVLVRTRGHLLVYDTGPRQGADSDAGARLLLPLLRARGERAIDHLVLSHGDTDHIGGAASLLEALPVRRVSHGLPQGHALEPLLPAARRCADGQRWAWDGVAFEVLHPPPGPPLPGARPNGLSCVLRITAANGRRALLTGDIEAAQEAALVARHGAGGLRSHWLMAPHHGSRTSSTAALLDAVAPEVAVAQAAYRSRFGHPAPDVVARYHARGILLRRSDTCGAHTWRSWVASPGICEREARRRYWHHGAR